MKKISLIISLIFTSVTGILTSCSEDYPGPDPVDVTANYSNKFSNPNPTLTLVYNGENMTGKSVDFSTVKGETANLTFYDILPGEKAIKITSIPLSGLIYLSQEMQRDTLFKAKASVLPPKAPLIMRDA